MISEYKLSVRSDQSKQRFVVMNSQLIYVVFFFESVTLMTETKDQYTLFYNF